MYITTVDIFCDKAESEYCLCWIGDNWTTKTEAKEEAKKFGWLFVKGEAICPKCQHTKKKSINSKQNVIYLEERRNN